MLLCDIFCEDATGHKLAWIADGAKCATSISPIIIVLHLVHEIANQSDTHPSPSLLHAICCS